MPLFTGFYTSQVVIAGFLNHQTVSSCSIYLLELYRHHQWKGWKNADRSCNEVADASFSQQLRMGLDSKLGRRQTHLKTTWVMQEKSIEGTHYHYFNMSQLCKVIFYHIFVAPIVKEDYKTTKIPRIRCLLKFENWKLLRWSSSTNSSLVEGVGKSSFLGIFHTGVGFLVKAFIWVLIQK